MKDCVVDSKMLYNHARLVTVSLFINLFLHVITQKDTETQIPRYRKTVHTLTRRELFFQIKTENLRDVLECVG